MLGRRRRRMELSGSQKTGNHEPIGFGENILPFPPDSVLFEFSENAKPGFCLCPDTHG